MRTGDRSTLDAAIDLFRQAVEATPADYPDRARYLFNLCGALRTRFQRGGQLADLDAAIAAGQAAVDATPADHPNHAAMLFSLSDALRIRAGIAAGQAAVGATPQTAMNAPRPTALDALRPAEVDAPRPAAAARAEPASAYSEDSRRSRQRRSSRRSEATLGRAPVRVHVRAQCDPTVLVAEWFSVSVIVSLEEIRRALGPGDVAESVDAFPDQPLVVEVLQRANVKVQGTARRSVPMPGPGEPRVVLFQAVAAFPGDGGLWVVVSQAQVPLCTLELRVQIIDPSAGTTPGTDNPSGPLTKEAVGVVPADGGRALNMLRIVEDEQGDHVVYRYDLEAPDLRLLARFDSRPVRRDRDEYVRSIYQQIENCWLGVGRDVEQFHEELRALGGVLLDELVPPGLRALLWEYRHRLRHIVVLSTEPFIPWELLHLKEPGTDRLPAQTCFFGQLGLVRWRLAPSDGLGKAWDGWPPSRLPLRPGRARYLIPDYPDRQYALPAVDTERRYLTDNLQATPVQPHFRETVELLRKADDFDLLHFAGHAVASSEKIADAHLLLEGRREAWTDGGDRYVPEQLRISVVAQNLAAAGGHRPIVVLNACQAGRLGNQLSSTGGFAEAFLSGGAGIFIAALWSVDDMPAATFITALYDQLLAGATLTEATAAAREQARLHGDSTWLAYTVYGHPEARLHVPRPIQHTPSHDRDHATS